MLRKKSNVFTLQVHTEITPGNKVCILSMLEALKLILSITMSTSFELVQLENPQLVEKLIRKLLMVFYMQGTLETNVSRLLFKAG